MTKSRDRLPDGLSPLKHSFQVRPSVAIAGTISPTAYAQTPDAQTSDSVTLSSTAQSLLSNSPSTTSNSTEPTPAEVALQTLQAGAASDSANIALQTLKSINKGPARRPGEFVGKRCDGERRHQRAQSDGSGRALSPGTEGRRLQPGPCERSLELMRMFLTTASKSVWAS
jgi:hypothetical protein